MRPQIILSESASKELKKLDLSLTRRIVERLLQIIEYPGKDAIKLAGVPYFRLRAWNYNAIFDMQKNTIRILAIKIRHRGGIKRKIKKTSSAEKVLAT